MMFMLMLDLKTPERHLIHYKVVYIVKVWTGKLQFIYLIHAVEA